MRWDGGGQPLNATSPKPPPKPSKTLGQNPLKRPQTQPQKQSGATDRRRMRSPKRHQRHCTVIRRKPTDQQIQ